MAPRRRNQDLREACVAEALAIIETSGVESLSLREVSRRLGVSHQAPYKHFPSRDHILAEIVGRAYAAFAEYLESRRKPGDPHGDLKAMGECYLTYALSHPLQYRLMFGTPLPDPAEHPEMLRQARHAFALLRDGIAKLPADRRKPSDEKGVALDALFIWSALHGLASVLQSHAMETLDLPKGVLDQAIPHVLSRIGDAFESEIDKT